MDFKCQNCGASLDISEDNIDNSEIKCPYCQSVASPEILLAYFKILNEKQAVKQGFEENELDKELKRELLNELKLQKEKRKKEEEIARKNEEVNRIEEVAVSVLKIITSIIIIGIIIAYIVFVFWVAFILPRE